MVNDRIREADLIIPVLKLIADNSDEDGGLDITRIDQLLRLRMKLSEQDRVILKGRKDDRFSQVVRNLVSHRTLEKRGLAIYRKREGYRRGAYYLTDQGAEKASAKPRDLQLNLFNERK